MRVKAIIMDRDHARGSQVVMLNVDGFGPEICYEALFSHMGWGDVDWSDEFNQVSFDSNGVIIFENEEFNYIFVED